MSKPPALDFPIRIAFCITELDPGGAEQALVELVSRLDRKIYSAMVFCLGPRGSLVETLESRGIPVTCLGARNAWQIGIVFRLSKALRKFRPVILQTWLFHANLLGRVAARLANIPIVVSGIRVAEQRGSWRPRADRLTQFLVHAHVCVSEDVARFSIKRGGLDAKRMHVIPNAVDFERFANAESIPLSKLGIPPRAKVVLFVGRMDPQKDPAWLLDVFPAIKTFVRDVHLMFVGKGPLDSVIAERIRVLGLAKSVHQLGWRGDVPELLKTADVLVVPSRWEGMPNVILEAFAAGTPVVATDVDGISQLIEHGQTGLVVSSRNSGELCESVVEILDDPERSAKMAKVAQVISQKQFTHQASTDAYSRLYQDLIGNLTSDRREKSDFPSREK